MATTSLMVQFYTEQDYDATVTVVPELEDEAYLFLDAGQSTVIREIATEEIGGILASDYSGGVPIGVTSKAFAEVRLVSPGREADLWFYAPSHVPSPPVTGFGLAVLRVREAGIALYGGQLSLSRGIGAHLYVDQIG